MSGGLDSRIVALVAAFERADSVGATVVALRHLPGVHEVVVIDDGSRDATADAARAAGARVVRLRSNLGKGDAIAAGVAATPDATLYLLVDADVGATASAADALLGPVLAGEADMTIGVLPGAGGRGGFGLVRGLGRWGIRRACGFLADAPLSGQRAVRAELLRRLRPAPRFGLEVGMTIDAVRLGARVLEVPVGMDHRHTGRRLGGFAHRGRQGADIVRALWPRVTSSSTRMLALLLVVITTFAGVGWSGTRWEPSTAGLGARPARVVIVGVKGLEWSDLGSGRLPNVDRLLARGALGALGGRTGSPGPDVASAYATLGAGRPVRAGGRDGPDSGAFGSALHAAGLRTAVAAGTGTGAAYGLADGTGLVDAAEFVGDGDLVGLLAAADRSVAAADVVLVDATGLAGTAVDAVVGRLARAPDTLLIVASVTPAGRQWRLGPVIVGGPGVVRGYLQTTSTKRLGLVTLTDIAPTVLSATGATVPATMLGHDLRYHAGVAAPSRLARLDRDSSYREAIYPRVTFAYVVLQVLLYLVALVALARRNGPGGVAPVLRLGVVALAAWPLATYAFRAVAGSAALGVGAVGLLIALESALVGLALRSRTRPLGQLRWLMGATAWLIILDVATGARLQVASVMGYSPQTGARFFGIGNVGFALLTATSILAACLHLERAPRRREAFFAVGAFLALVVVVDGAPWLGSDAGGILTLVPVCALLVYGLSGRRVTWRAATFAVLGTVACLGFVALGDLLRPAGAASHVGGFLGDLVNGNASRSTATLARKFKANVDVLRITGAWCVPVVAGLLLRLLVRGRRMTDLLPLRSPLRAGVVATLAAGLVGSVVNDSGVVIAGVVLAYVAPVLTLLALERAGGDRSVSAPT